jgi:two-component system response regulator FixJ
MDLTVFIVDDEEGIRKALIRMFRLAGLEATGFASAQEFLDAYRPGQGGCLVLDLSMPSMNGLELQEALSARAVSLPIIFLTGHGNVSSAVSAMKHGAADFLEKPFDSEALIERVRHALEQFARERDLAGRRAEAASRYESLTPREREVMALVVTGLSSKEIARELGASKKTIDIHRARIMSKMAATSLAELVHMARLLPASS